MVLRSAPIHFSLCCMSPSTRTNLNVHLDDCLANEGGTKEGPERNEKMTAGDTSQVK